MLILGLHFGHDASVAVLTDGEIISCVSRERQARVKHAMTLDVKTICKALKDADITSEQIDFCAITSTQGIELIIDDPNEVSIFFGDNKMASNIPCSMDVDKLPILSWGVRGSLFSADDSSKSAVYTRKMLSKYFPEYESCESNKNEFCGWIDEYVYDEMWHPPKTLKALSSTKLSPGVKNEFLRYGFHYPASIRLQGCLLPAFFVNHHACHAASSYYQSGFNRAAILVQDGGSGIGCDSGMYYYAEENRLYPIAPHHSIVGVLYDLVAFFMNLGQSSAGKLMGLAAYGKPTFYDRKFLANRNDFVDMTHEIDCTNIAEYWLHHCLSLAKDMGYDLQPFGDTEKMISPINIDIAASTQKMFEENTLYLTEVFHNYLRQNGILVDSLCLSGGTALNCPSNSRIFREGRFKKVFVEPGCDDSGLAIGAALSCYHNLLDQPLLKNTSRYFSSPFLGPRIGESDILSAIDFFKEYIQCEKMPDCALDAAQELEKNKVIGWFYGRSEIGPRALGHRSILADARDEKNWERVNKIKKRELWRPFAPAVLESEAEKWFSGAPIPSPHMLFNAILKSKEIPAITHVDGSARIQTVNENDGVFYNLLVEFFEITGVPILLNTSFNGPAEPIVETPTDAIKFFVDSELDVLYLNSYKIKRKSVNKLVGAKSTYSIESKKTTALDIKKFFMDIETAQRQRQSIYFLVEANFKGFNIIVFDGSFWGTRHSFLLSNLHSRDMLLSLYAQEEEDVIVGDSVEAVRLQINQLQLKAPLDTPPALQKIDLIEDFNGYNLFKTRNRFLAVLQTFGHVDLMVERLGERDLPPFLFIGDSLENIKLLLSNRAEADAVRQEAVAACERAMEVVSALEAQLTRCKFEIETHQQLISKFQANWVLRITRVIKRVLLRNK